MRASVPCVSLLFVLMVIAGCGNAYMAPLAPPAQEGFRNQSFNGNYAFSVTGQDGAGFFAFAGSLQANGSGAITGGTVDLNTGTLSAPVSTSLSGSYTVQSDGRTTANLSTSAGTAFTLDFVLLSTSKGLVVRFDSAGTASGSIDLQNSSAFSDTALAGSFAFNLAGIDVNGNPETTAGTLTLNSAGAISTGVQDVNDDGGISADETITGGTVLSPTNGRGTITITSSVGTFDFAFYVIDANHLRLVSTDTLPVFAGDAFRQPSPLSTSSAFAAGSFVFTLAGSSGFNPLVQGGILTADGNGNITAGTEDLNLAGTLTENLPVTGTYSVSGTGRGTLSLDSGQSFAIYPTITGGLEIMDLSNTDEGTASEQSATAFSNATIKGPYGLNFTGVNANEDVEIDVISQFTADGNGNITSGAVDLNNGGSLAPGSPLTGTCTTSANGRGTAVLNFAGAGSLGLLNVNLIYYVVSSSQVMFIEADTAQPAIGVFSGQTPQVVAATP